MFRIENIQYGQREPQREFVFKREIARLKKKVEYKFGNRYSEDIIYRTNFP